MTATDRRNAKMYNKLLRLDCIVLQKYEALGDTDWNNKELLFRSKAGKCADFRMTPADFLNLETLDNVG